MLYIVQSNVKLYNKCYILYNKKHRKDLILYNQKKLQSYKVTKKIKNSKKKLLFLLFLLFIIFLYK